MFLTSARRSTRRRGALLIAVLGLLTLFAIFALFFVFYADAEATGARIAREKEAPGEAGPPNDYAIQAFNLTLRSILFDDYDVGGVLNPLRGHSLARSMYGFTGAAGASAPFAGHGTFHENAPTGGDRAAWINFSSPYTIPTGPQAGTYYLDPEWNLFRTAAQVNANQAPGTIPGFPQTYIPKNAPYTYPDLKDLILGCLSPATGEVLVPSLHRNWLFNAGNPNQQFRLAPWNPSDTNPATNTAANTDWVNPEGRTRILRPRPVDQLTPGDLSSAGLPSPLPPNFTASATGPQLSALFGLISNRIATGQIIPYPPLNANGSFSGDVQNLQGGIGQGGSLPPGSALQKNDSILIDIGLPPRLWNGKWIKPLASVLVTDLDGLLNLNAQGNVRAMGNHGSHNGFGPNEVNLGQLLGAADANNLVMARYGIPMWKPATPYALGSVVFNAGNFYRCVVAGTSGAPPGPTGSGTAPPPPPSNMPVMDGSVGWQTDFAFGIPRNGVGGLAMDRANIRTLTYSATNFDAGGNGASTQLPSFLSAPPNAFQVSPTFSNNGTQDFFDDGIHLGVSDGVVSYNKYQNHPLLWNPADWPAGVAGRRTYPLSDLKRLNLKYAADLDWYLQTDLARFNIANVSLIGSTPPGNSYRLDGAHSRRMLTTPLSTSLDQTGLVGNFNTSSAGTPVLLAGDVAAGRLHPTSAAFLGTFAGGAGNDFNAPNDFRNPKASLGPIDLNRPLTDYRRDPNVPLGQPSVTPPGDPTNSGNYAQAWTDRQNLARDIFARLIVVTGAHAFVDPSTGNATLPQPAGPGIYTLTVGLNPPVPVSQNEYNALRYLAQLAANMVDTIDSDDVSTAFVWNPSNALGPTPLAQFDFTTFNTVIAPTSMADLPNRAVFGVEKPRLVLNEAYGEITNNPAEMLAGGPATMPARVRFWVELANPTSTPYVAGTGPLGNGGATVYIPPMGLNPAISSYQLQVTQVNPAIASSLKDPTNPSGAVLPAAGASFTFDFSTATAAQRTILPVTGAYAPVNGSPGFILAGASPFGPNQHTVAGTTVEFSPNGLAPYTTQMITGNALGIGGATTAMEYDYGSMPAAASLETAGTMQPLRRHAVLLRRLANPYLPFNPATNPYITVDVMDYVPAYDAVTRGGGAGDAANRTPKVAPGITSAGFEQVDGTSGGNRRASVGKVQPYAGFANQGIPAMMGDVAEIGMFPNSMVIRQNPTGARIPIPGQPLHTFFSMNGRNAVAPGAQTYSAGPAPPASLTVAGFTETIMAPFEWFVHYDRPLVNPFELFLLQATKPHEVTQHFIRPPDGTGNLVRYMGLTPWVGVSSNPSTLGQPGFNVGPPALTYNGLYRALDLLRVKPWTYGTALGGKVHGKININTIPDPRVLLALLDPQAGNSFTAANIYNPAMPTDPTTLWGRYITTGPGARTVGTIPRSLADGTSVFTGAVPMPGPTYDDVPNPFGPNFGTVPPYDRPFRSFGAAEYSPDTGSPPTVLTARYGSGFQDSLIRVNPTTGAPLIAVTSQTHLYLQSEMARKMFNNTTTTSNAFAISVTIVFHEVRMNGASPMFVNEGAGNRYLIGKEASKDVPGDLRQQFYAVVDRSNLGLDPTAVPWSPVTAYAAGQKVLNGPYAYQSLNAGTSGAVGTSGPTGTGTAISDGTVVWRISSALQPQPLSASLDQPVVIGNTAPTTPPPGFIPPPAGSYNVYLSNSTTQPVLGPNPYTTAANPFTTTVYADGKPIVIGTNSVITIGVGASREPTPLLVNYANQDGSLNVGGPGLPAPTKLHAPGELVSNYTLGNPGIEPLFDFRNAFYGAVVPYAKRVR